MMTILETMTRRKVLVNTSFLTFVLVVLLCWSAVVADNYEYTPTHQKIQEESFLDFSNDNLLGDPAEAAHQVAHRLAATFENRLETVFQRAKTPECRAKIAEHFGYFVNAIALESSLPFGDVEFENSCPEPIYDFENLPEGMHFGHIQNRTYQPDDGIYIDNPAELKLLYAILTHRNPAETIRLVEILYEPGHLFVIHVDGKESSNDTYEYLLRYSEDKDYVHLIPHPYRCRVNWGGFSMVNATMQVLKYSFGLDPSLNGTPLDFHKFVHMSSTSYPLASNTKIRQMLASFPLDANLMNIVMKPTRPHPSAWFYFVECDDWVHRIYRQRPLNELNGGIEIYTSSQWFIFSREFAEFIAKAQPGTLVHDLLEYVEHVVVADEAFFGTLLRNTEFCTKHHNWNFVHLQFDHWESELEDGARDDRKCIMKNKDHCGRSPTTLTSDYSALLELTGDLFARKFLDHVDADIKDYIDSLRYRQELELTGKAKKRTPPTEFEGHGVLIVAKETVQDGIPLCLGIGPTGNKVRLVQCFHDHVLPTLAINWETGAVVVEEVAEHNRWNIGPCSSDGILHRSEETAELFVTAGNFSRTGPGCMITQADGIRAGRCLDADSGIQPSPGGTAQVYPCAKRWHQFFSFGNGEVTPRNAIYSTIPRFIVHGLKQNGHPEQEQYLCLGVRGRGHKDEGAWVEDTQMEEGEHLVPDNLDREEGLLQLHKWNGMQLVSTQCSNKGAIIEWIYVPFIVEDVNGATNLTEKQTEGGDSTEEL